MNGSTRDSLRPIDVDLLDILSARDCPLPPETVLGTADMSEGYRGTAEDFRWALKMRLEATHRAIRRDRTESREWAKKKPAIKPDDSTAKVATEFLRKMQVAENLGLAEWDGTNWRPKPEPRTKPITKDREYPPFTESMITSYFHKARKVGRDRWTACCPAHDDHNPSLSITRGNTHWLFTCWSHRCDWLSIIQAAGLHGLDFRIAS
jgi:hypothetical protein